jgi:hypothetical protein
MALVLILIMHGLRAHPYHAWPRCSSLSCMASVLSLIIGVQWQKRAQMLLLIKVIQGSYMQHTHTGVTEFAAQ